MSEKIDIIFKQGDTSMAHCTLESFAKMTKMTESDALEYFRKHAVPLEVEGWYEVDLRKLL